MATEYTRSYDDYLIDIGDRVEFIVDGWKMQGTVRGRTFSGSYFKITGDNGILYKAYAGEEGLRKLFED